MSSASDGWITLLDTQLAMARSEELAQLFGHPSSGGQQVGYGYGAATGYNTHALLWSGSAASVVALHPAGFTESYARGISGGQQVGGGRGAATGNSWHALLWSASAASVVDLNPAGFTVSSARGISGGQQVGEGWGTATGNNSHALLWSGSAASAVDLHHFLPAGFVASRAWAIDAQGNVVGEAYYAAGTAHAILWANVPEPGSMAMLVVAVLCLLAYALRRMAPIAPLSVCRRHKRLLTSLLLLTRPR